MESVESLARTTVAKLPVFTVTAAYVRRQTELDFMLTFLGFILLPEPLICHSVEETGLKPVEIGAKDDVRTTKPKIRDVTVRTLLWQTVQRGYKRSRKKDQRQNVLLHSSCFAAMEKATIFKRR